MKSKLIVALDVSSKREAVKWAERLIKQTDLFKIGLQMLMSEGPSVVADIRKAGGRVFLDGKFHDIPSTVSRAVEAAGKSGAFMINVHCLGGLSMLEAAKSTAACSGQAAKPLVLGVTVLTSMDDRGLEEVGIRNSAKTQVVKLAKLAKKAGLDGVVASPLEIREIRKACGENFIIVTPGIRAPGDAAGGQKRTLSAREAVESGADYIVVGRPILASKDPIASAKMLVEEISGL